MSDRTLSGSCLCNAVRFKVEGSPGEVLRCHCGMCRKAHGAAYATFARFPREALRIVAGNDSIAIYRSSSEARRTFCRHCGSALQFLRDDDPTFGLALSVLDTPLDDPPIEDYCVSSRVRW